MVLRVHNDNIAFTIGLLSIVPEKRGGQGRAKQDCPAITLRIEETFTPTPSKLSTWFLCDELLGQAKYIFQKKTTMHTELEYLISQNLSFRNTHLSMGQL